MNNRLNETLRSKRGCRIAAALALAGAITIVLMTDVRGQSVASANARFKWVDGAQASGNLPDLAFDTSGNCYAIWQFNSTNATVGGTTLTNTGGYDNFLVKYNGQGQPQWLQQFSGTHTDFGLAVAVDSTGSAYVVGNYYSDVLTVGNLSVTNAFATTDSAIFIAKFNTGGTPLWMRSFGGNGIDTAFHVAVDQSNNVLVAGSFFSTTLAFDSFTLTNVGDSDIFLAKFDSDGQTLWAQHAGGSKPDSCYRIAVDAQNNSYLTGYYTGTASFGTINVAGIGSFDTYIAKYDSAGNAQWVTTGGGSGTDEGFGIALDNAGNSYVTGYFNSSTATFGGQTIHTAGGNDIFTVKLSPSGAVLWARSAGGTGDDKGRAITVDVQGNAYVAAYFSGTATFGNITLTSAGGDDICIIKYDPSGNVKWVIPAGGLSDDVANAIHIDPNSHLYIAGTCSSNIIFGGLTFTNPTNGAPFLARLDFLPPAIAVSGANGNPTISWGTNFLTPVVPQQSTDLSHWQDATNLPVLLNGAYTITNLAPANFSFYRLRNIN
jgi:hypothetical protein